MKKYWSFILAVVLGLSVLSSVPTMLAAGTGQALVPKEVSQEEAAKKYPPVKGSYPAGIVTETRGFCQSPYSSRVYDCRTVGHGALILDEGVKKVFVRP
jgi:hypothetical protein